MTGLSKNSTFNLEIPGYQLEEHIGQGGMGTVFRAVQLSLRRTVAVKILNPVPEGQSPAAAFQRESQLLASLAHPNLVTVYDCGQVDGRYFLVTEFIQGTTLRAKMEPGRPWSPGAARALLDRLARALSYIHEHGILHLDLKPENILCNQQGDFKIADFGLAITDVDARTLSEAGLSQGTMDYCAPEQRYGLGADERSDLFSLAVLSYELLTGRLPGRAYESARRLNPRLPKSVDEVLHRGLARAPEERYATVEEFRRHLTVALERRRASLVRRTVLLGVIAVPALAISMLLRSHSEEAGSPPGARSCLFYDGAESIGWMGQKAPEGTDWYPLRTAVRGPLPDGNDGLNLPAWPGPRPLLVIDSPEAQGFVQILLSPSFGHSLQSQWHKLVRTPPLPPENNIISGGQFSGDCLATDYRDDSRPWRIIEPRALVNGDAVSIAAPPGRPGESALQLVKADTKAPNREVGCYQWISRIPEQPGTTVVLRYRARAEEGSGQLCVRPELPLLIPQNDNSELAHRLRKASSTSAGNQSSEQGIDLRFYSPTAWTKPGPSWRTYYVVWQWPPYCTASTARNVVIVYVGLGKVWVDDVELFAWEAGAEP